MVSTTTFTDARKEEIKNIARVTCIAERHLSNRKEYAGLFVTGRVCEHERMRKLLFDSNRNSQLM